MVTLNKQVGDQAELDACQFLLKKGMTLIAANFRCTYGEIDLIMQDKKDMVFIEVRSRLNINFGSAIDSITTKKQKKIITSAIYFLQQRKLLNKINCRFDVIGIHSNNLEWIKDAFTTDIL